MGKYTADDNRSMQLNDNNDRYYSSREGNEVEEYDEIHEGERQMGSPFLKINGKLIKKSTITEVVPHYECTVEKVENSRPSYGDPKTMVSLSYRFSIDIRTNYGAEFVVALPKMEPKSDSYTDDEFEYSPSYGRNQLVSEDNFENVIAHQNLGETVNMHPSFYETHGHETFSNGYCLSIVQRYMNSIFSK
jgi:hypothetical protein